MSDVSHAKFITSYHSNGEETEVPDLYYRYNQQSVNVYSRIEGNRLISTVTTHDLDNIAGEQQLMIQNVLEATFRNKPILVIVTTTTKSMDNFFKPRIYAFWHRILENDTRMVHFNLPMVGDLSVIAMTSQPFVLVHKSTKEIQEQQRVRHLLAFGKRNQSLQIALLDDSGLPDNRVRGQVTDVELPSDISGSGDITAIHILPQCTRDQRLWYGDPRIFVGTSNSYIHVLRFKAQFKKETRNGIHVEPSYTWKEKIRHGKSSITYLACKRALENNSVIAAIGQDQTNNGDDSLHSNNNNKTSGNASLFVIEWPGNLTRKILNTLAPQKLTSYTLTSIRIIPTTKNYQVTAIFQSTHDKQHFEIDIWTIEKRDAKLVLSDEIFEYDIGSTPQDVWPIHLTSRYMLLTHESNPTEIDINNTNATISLETNENGELSKEYKADQPLNDNETDFTHMNGTTDFASAHAQDDNEQYDINTLSPSDSTMSTNEHDELSSEDERDQLLNNKETDDINNNGTTDSTSTYAQGDDEQHSITTIKPCDSTMTIENNNSITLDVSTENDEKETVTDVDDSIQVMENDNSINTDTTSPLLLDDYEKRTQQTSLDANDDLLDQFVDKVGDISDAYDGLDFDTSDQQNDDSAMQFGNKRDNAYNNKNDASNANGVEISIDDNNNDSMKTNGFGTGNDSHDDYTATTHDSNKASINMKERSIETSETNTSIPDNEVLLFDDSINNNTLSGSNDTTSAGNESISPEHTLQHILSTATIPIISRNTRKNERLLDNTTQHICKLETDTTELGSNDIHFETTSSTVPSLEVVAEPSDVKPPSSPPTIILGNKEMAPPTPKMLYKTKIMKIAEASLSDGLDLIRNDKTPELNQRERIWVLFDIIFSTTTTATTKTLDIDKAMGMLESLPLDAMEQDWLMNYCFTHENQLLKLFIMRYNIKRENYGLVLMQYETMKTMESGNGRQDQHAQSSDGGGDKIPSEKVVTNDIERTCNNLTKLCRDMVPLVLQDLPLEIFGQTRGKVGNPFLNKQKSSLLQEKGLGLGGSLLAQVMESRKRRRLD